jgi:hypothetical protein
MPQRSLHGSTVRNIPRGADVTVMPLQPGRTQAPILVTQATYDYCPHHGGRTPSLLPQLPRAAPSDRLHFIAQPYSEVYWNCCQVPHCNASPYTVAGRMICATPAGGRKELPTLLAVWNFRAVNRRQPPRPSNPAQPRVGCAYRQAYLCGSRTPSSPRSCYPARGVPTRTGERPPTTARAHVTCLLQLLQHLCGEVKPCTSNIPLSSCEVRSQQYTACSGTSSSRTPSPSTMQPSTGGLHCGTYRFDSAVCGAAIRLHSNAKPPFGSETGEHSSCDNQGWMIFCVHETPHQGHFTIAHRHSTLEFVV